MFGLYRAVSAVTYDTIRAGTPRAQRRRGAARDSLHDRPSDENEVIMVDASQSVSQLFHGPAPRSPLHRLAVMVDANVTQKYRSDV